MLSSTSVVVDKHSVAQLLLGTTGDLGIKAHGGAAMTEEMFKLEISGICEDLVFGLGRVALC